jgi:hypothetical protein
MWWTSIAPLLGVVDAPITQLQDSFESTLSADNIILPRQARAVFREWWWDIDDDRSMLARYGATALMRSRIDSLIADAQLKAKDFWFEADASHRSLLEFLCPELVNKLITHGEHVASLNQSLHEAAHQAPKNLADLMVQRREELLMQKIPHSDLFEIVARERMLELRHRIDEMKIHMAALHTRAKEHRADDRRTQQFDDTVSLQDSVAALLKQIVPAQSELKLLEKSIAELMEEFVREITPALVAIRGSMSPLHAEALAILHFRDKLSRRIESTISANRDVLICELESLWNRFEEGILITSKLEL